MVTDAIHVLATASRTNTQTKTQTHTQTHEPQEHKAVKEQASTGVTTAARQQARFPGHCLTEQAHPLDQRCNCTQTTTGQH